MALREGGEAGEEITGRVEVTAVRDDKPICTIATTVSTAQGEVCLIGTATTYTVPLRAVTNRPTAKLKGGATIYGGRLNDRW
jgi:hypothetical protein